MAKVISILICGPVASTEPKFGRIISPILQEIVTGLCRQFDPDGSAVDIETLCRTDGCYWFPSVFIERIIKVLLSRGIDVEPLASIPDSKVRVNLSPNPVQRQIAREVIGRPRMLFYIGSGSMVTEQDVVEAIASTHQGPIKRLDGGVSADGLSNVSREGECLIMAIPDAGEPRTVVDCLLDERLTNNRYYGVMARRPQTADEAIWLYALFGPAVRVLGPASWNPCAVDFIRNPRPDQIPPLLFALSLATIIGCPTQQTSPIDSLPYQWDGVVQHGHLFGDRPPIYLVVDTAAQRQELEGMIRESDGPRRLRVILRPELPTLSLSGGIVILACRWTLSDLAIAEGTDSRQAPPRRIVAVTDRANEALAAAAG